MAGEPDPRVPGYLGRVLDGDGDPAGTCFQVAPGVLVTAWHVLGEVGAAEAGAGVRVDPLAGGAPFGAAVARLDPVADVAVLTCTRGGLAACAGPLSATGGVGLRAPVRVTGHVVADDPGHSYRFLDAAGEWAGGTTRDDAVPLGCLTSHRVLRGMSGAPVIRDGDGHVVGVVSGRYNSADGWLRDTVWVARTEDLVPLLAGIAGDIVVGEVVAAGAVDLTLTVTVERVRLSGPGIDVSAVHGGVRPGLAGAVHEVRRVRARAGRVLRAELEAAGLPGELSLARAGRLLAESFLPGPVAAELGKAVQAAERAHQPVRVGLEISQDLAWLPWECLPGPGGGPLALHPLISVYRTAETAAGRLLPGPLRIVVAIAAPDDSGGGVVDYEGHLRSVVAAVRSARQSGADVRVVPFAVLRAIREELERAPAHVLHVYCHGQPGLLELEDDDGKARMVSAEEFLAEAIPPGAIPPVITLSACYTDAAAAQGGPSFATELGRHGAAAVIATETSVTGTYATRLFARLYGTLARIAAPDVIAALAAARRDVQAELRNSRDRRDQDLAALDEWAVVTVLAAGPAVPVIDPGQAKPAPPPPPEPPRIAGLAARGPWYFVGRRAEQRSWPADLTGPDRAGIVIFGIGGTGKTTLAAEITAGIRDREPGRILVSMTGPLTLDGLLDAVISAVRRQILVRGPANAAPVGALDAASRVDLQWQDRWAILREHILGTAPVLAVLDNFEDNLQPGDGDAGYAVRDEVLAGLLAAWITDPGAARLLITCRYPFALPGGAEQSLSFRQLGPLSRAETMKLAWSLPALDRLDEAQLDRVWRLAGGHPRSLEYLDALLTGGGARYPDVTTRLAAAISRRLGGASRDQWLAARTALDAALAETVALAADDVLLDDLLRRLTPGEADLLVGISVYREPVDLNTVLFQAGQPDHAAEDIPDRAAAARRIAEVLAAAGIAVDESLDLASVPEQVRELLGPHIQELNRVPAPPFRAPPDLAGQITACQQASLLTVSTAGREPRFFVHRWTATELAGRAGRGKSPQLAQAHRRAAGYWQWRVRVWPQDKAADVHDLLEARHHLLAAGDTEDAGRVTEWICTQLDTWGAWDQEAALIHDTLSRLPPDSPRQAAWIHQLGTVAYQRGDYNEAARQYQRSLDIEERLGNQADTARSYHQLDMLAQARGDYDEAARQYQRSLDISERFGDQADTAKTYHNLGNVAYLRGNYDEATRQAQRSLDIKEQLGNQAGMASSYHQLGMLAQARGDYDEAARQYQRSLDINERFGNQADMAATYHQLGRIAQDRGDYDEAARQYQRSLDIEERLGNQAGMASSYHQLGRIAELGGDNDEAARQYQRSLDISERLGNQAGMAATYHQLGVLAQDRADYDEAARQYQRSLDIEERLGNQAGMASSYHQLGRIAELGGDNDEAARQYQRSLDISERLGNQAGMAATYHQLGVLAQARGDYDEAARQYQRSLDISERLGNQAGMATTYHQLGVLAQDRADYDEAARQYQRSLDIEERLGNQAGMATTYSQLGNLEAERGGNVGLAISWHLKALTIRLRLGDPQAMNNLRRLAAHRGELGAEPFTDLLTRAAGDPDLAATIQSLLDQMEAADSSP